LKKALFIGYVWPEPNTTAAGNRMLQLLQAFLKKGYEVIFASTALPTKYSFDLKTLDIQTTRIALNDASFDDYVANIKPDIVVFDRFMVEEQFGWRVAAAVPNAVRILNTEDLHSLRKLREACLKNKERFTIDKWLEFSMTKREIASIYRCDLTLLVSTFEMELLKDTLRIAADLYCHLPFLLDEITSDERENWPNFGLRKDYICFGNGKHAPNVDAICFLKQEIWPLICKEQHGATVHIYGAYLPQKVLQLHKPKEGFLVHGWVDRLDEKLKNCRINLAPLRFGAGIKGKLTKSMQNGVPSITTSIGAEGMYENLNWCGKLADDPVDFAQKAVALYQNQDEWFRKQENGMQIINEHYNKSLLLPNFFNTLNTLQKNLSLHRRQNFIGAMLMHETLSGTKYMAKWIEEKNKNA